MDLQPYIARAVDGIGFELLPDGTLLVWDRSTQQPIVLRPEVTYALYVLLRIPGIAPALRHLDDERQRLAWERRQAA